MHIDSLDPTNFRISTYNLRYDSMPDNITVSQSISALGNPLVQETFLGLSGEQPWSTRRLRVSEHLLSEGTIISGFQEALVRQVTDLAELFGDDWGWIGVGRDDGVEAGEFSPLFYKKSAVKLLSNDTFWLSLTPFEPSKYPGAGSFRLCTVANFSLTTGAKTKFTVLNTHLDDQSDMQRQVGASLILTRARYEAVRSRGPVFVTGDFNSPSTGNSSGAYNIITGAIPPVAINATFAAKYNVGNQLPDFKMLDLRGQAPRQSVSNNFATYTGFNGPADTSVWQRIDFIFGGSNLGWYAYKVGSSLSDDGTLASDHRPVFVDVAI
ncbi:Endonuclease/exonuclease/phosphatase [Desarmillaria tabescens]|uniref:Endonuclease/exonuclease/phosphatase n=1 Tax=Armillaria tabescens TaxID=1929756 RepID=A0AA39MYZ7_ARMTA|nr:Endonuclease/exonuclease/phosphatase [Desarmillaria tabescens]KAK0452086.1 Endonuclease/exonuclease/phosphatase [Desarmillaria tabescens]